MIISGGQTGVDRIALDFAMQAGLLCGGWCPKGRRAEDGVIPAVYPLRETSSELYQQRTRLNVRDSDATMIITDSQHNSRGTALTVKYAVQLGRPLLVIDIASFQRKIAMKWLWQFRPKILNIAGPRASESALTTSAAGAILPRLLEKAQDQAVEALIWPPRRPFTRRLF